MKSIFGTLIVGMALLTMFAEQVEADSPNAPEVTNRVDEKKAQQMHIEAWEAKRNAIKPSSVLGSDYERMHCSKRWDDLGWRTTCIQQPREAKDIPNPFNKGLTKKTDAKIKRENYGSYEEDNGLTTDDEAYNDVSVVNYASEVYRN